MSKEQNQAKANKTTPLVLLLAAVLSALAGFLVVYIAAGPGGAPGPADTKQLSDSSKTSTTPANSGEKSDAAATGLKRLATGQMAKFQAHPEPREVPEVSFEDDSGSKRSITEWKGKVVLLNLWATWCAPCRKEMPALDKLKADLGGDSFDVVAISIDRTGRDKPKEFLDKIGVKSLKFFIDESGKLFLSLKAVGMPTTLLIDRNGKEIGRLVGPAEWDSEDAVNLLKAAISQEPSS